VQVRHPVGGPVLQLRQQAALVALVPIRPVNPRGGSVLGEPVARSLSEVDGPVDVVDVFRPADEAPKIARQAIDIGAKVLWL
jgi:predicted CoA-binding protein